MSDRKKRDANLDLLRILSMLLIIFLHSIKMCSAIFPLIQLGCVIAIFIVCITIDAIRRATVGKLENTNRLNLFCNAIYKKCWNIYKKCFWRAVR